MKTRKQFLVRKNSSFFKVAIVLSLLVFNSASLLNAQVTVGANTTPNATLDVVASDPSNATIPEGVIAPRLTGDQIKAKDLIYLAAQNGAIVYATSAVSGVPAGKTINITASGYYYYDAPNTVWQALKATSSGGTYSGSTSIHLDGTSFQRETLSGDVSAARNVNAVTVTGIQNNPVSTTSPTTGQVLKWNGSAWTPDTDDNTGGGSTYTGSTSIHLDGTNIQREALSGDVSATRNSNNVTVTRIQTRPVSTAAPTTGYVLKWNGSAWAPAPDEDSYSSTTVIVGVTSVSPSWGSGVTFNPTSYTGSSWADTGTRITLPVGRWLIMASMLMTTNDMSYPNTGSQVWIRSTFQRVSGGSISYYDGSSTPNELISGNLYSSGRYMLSGYVVINVTGSPATLRYVVGNCELWGTWPSGRNIVSFGGKSGSAWRENSITAFALRN